MELDPQIWTTWSDERFNNWRRENDFPRIVEFLVEALPNFLDWLEHQDGLSKDDLMYHGPARFIMHYGQPAHLIDIDLRLPALLPANSEPVVTSLILSDDRFDEWKPLGQIFKHIKFESYTDWALRLRLPYIKDVVESLMPNNYSSDKVGPIYNTCKIDACFPLHSFSIRFEQLLKKEVPNRPKIPSLSLLKLGGKDSVVVVEDAAILEKNLEFTNLDNINFIRPIFTSFNQLNYCSLCKVSITGSLSHISFYRCAIGLKLINSGLNRCDFKYSNLSLSLSDTSLLGCKIVSRALKINDKFSEFRDCCFKYGELARYHPRAKSEFHRQAKMLFSRNGYPDLAGDHFLIEQSSKRQQLFSDFSNDKSKASPYSKAKSLVKSVAMGVIEIYWGYGERPFRIIKSSIVLISIIAALSFFTKSSSTYGDVVDSVSYGIQSFTNITFTEVNQTNRTLNFLSSIMSLIGLISVGLLVGSLASKTKKYS